MNANHPAPTLSGTLAYSAALVLHDDDAEAILKVIHDFIENEVDPKYLKNPKFGLPYVQNYAKQQDGSKIAVDGEKIYKFKRNELKKNKAGDIVKNDPPKILDGNGNVLVNPPEVRSGSEGRVFYDIYFYDKGGNVGVAMGLHGVQIKSLAADFTDDADAIEGGWTEGSKPTAAANPGWGEGDDESDDVLF